MDAEVKTGSILDRIVEARRIAFQHRMRVLPLPVLRMAVEGSEPPRDFPGSLCRDGLNVVAELKRASPSRGLLRKDFDPARLAAQLEQAGAAALSVLTEEDFFEGNLEHLRRARKATALPVLRKDFILDPWQVWETRAVGADSFLLIVGILSDAALRELIVLGRELKMEPLVEVHTGPELDRALEAGARILGANNRDLSTFAVRIETSFELIEAIPNDCVAVSESGIGTHEDLERLRASGFDAFLVGEHLMQSADSEAALRKLMQSEI